MNSNVLRYSRFIFNYGREINISAGLLRSRHPGRRNVVNNFRKYRFQQIWQHCKKLAAGSDQEKMKKSTWRPRFTNIITFIAWCMKMSTKKLPKKKQIRTILHVYEWGFHGFISPRPPQEISFLYVLDCCPERSFDRYKYLLRRGKIIFSQTLMK